MQNRVYTKGVVPIWNLGLRRLLAVEPLPEQLPSEPQRPQCDIGVDEFDMPQLLKSLQEKHGGSVSYIPVRVVSVDDGVIIHAFDRDDGNVAVYKLGLGGFELLKSGSVDVGVPYSDIYTGHVFAGRDVNQGVWYYDGHVYAVYWYRLYYSQYVPSCNGQGFVLQSLVFKDDVLLYADDDTGECTAPPTAWYLEAEGGTAVVRCGHGYNTLWKFEHKRGDEQCEDYNYEYLAYCPRAVVYAKAVDRYAVYSTTFDGSKEYDYLRVYNRCERAFEHRFPIEADRKRRYYLAVYGGYASLLDEDDIYVYDSGGNFVDVYKSLEVFGVKFSLIHYNPGLFVSRYTLSMQKADEYSGGRVTQFLVRTDYRHIGFNCRFVGADNMFNLYYICSDGKAKVLKLCGLAGLALINQLSYMGIGIIDEANTQGGGGSGFE